MTFAERTASLLGFRVGNLVSKENIPEESEFTWYKKDAEGDWIAENSKGGLLIGGKKLKTLRGIEQLIQSIQKAESKPK